MWKHLAERTNYRLVYAVRFWLIERGMTMEALRQARRRNGSGQLSLGENRDNVPDASSIHAPYFMTSIAIVEDNDRLGRSLRRVVENTPDCQCVGMWRSGEEALGKVSAFRPDIVLLDMHVGAASGIEIATRLKAELPGLLVIMIAMPAEHTQILEALKAGACGYVLKGSSPEELRQAIVEVRNNSAAMTPEVVRRIVEAFRLPSSSQGREQTCAESLKLSPRETQLLAHLSEGLGNKEIAERMGLSIETVRTYLKHIYEKLHVRSRTEAALKYFTASGRK